MGAELPEGYKDSPVGIIPNEWEVISLGIFISGLVSGTSVNSENRAKEGNEKGILKTSAISGGKFFSGEHKAVYSNEVGRLKTPVEADTIIISRMNTPNLVGESGYISKNHPDLYLPDRLWMTKPSSIKHCVKWLSYCLQLPAIKQNIQSAASGTSNSMKNISKESFLSTLIALTPYPEQKKIARILSTVDRKLELIDQQITATHTLKKGLMQKLFSEGVGTQDASGQWQPHTEFKDSELGRIPAGWEVSSIGKGVSRYVGGASLKPADFTDSGVKVLSKVGVVPGGTLKIDSKSQKYCSDSYAMDNESSIVNHNFIVTVLRDLVPSGPSIGLIVKIPSDESYVLAQGTYGLEVDEHEYDEHYLINYSNSPAYRKVMQKTLVGSTQVHIRTPDFLAVNIPQPPLIEQQEIAKILSTTDRKLEHLTTQKSQTEQLKKGLMQKLLTGQIRVKPEPQDH